MANREADFSSETIRIVASRAGYRCSFPGCDETTIGPGSGSLDVESKGVAAHIFAASPGGPRGTGGLSIDERRSAMNGMWLCEDHAKLLDSHAGTHYPASELQAWKALHEQLIANELRKVGSSRIGWLRGIEIQRNPVFRHQSTLMFGKVTLLVGPNGSGKTAMCEWLTAAAGRFDLLERWAKPLGSPIRITLDLVAPDQHRLMLNFDGTAANCLFDGIPVTDFGRPLRVRYVRRRDWNRGELPDVEYLAQILDLHRYQVPQVVDEMTSARFGFVRRAEIRAHSASGIETKDLGATRLFAQTIGQGDLYPFGDLSGGEQSQVVMTGAVALADRDSRSGPAVLIADLGDQLISDSLLSDYARRLADRQFGFQTILVSPSPRPKVDWSGWSIARLEGQPPSVVVQQETIMT